jgi:hypothetical protein
MRCLTILKRLFLTSLLITPLISGAQSPFKGWENLFTVPLNYTVKHTNTPPVIDGDINDKVWDKAEWTAQFQDIEGDLKPHPALQTQVKMLWDDSCLYIAAKLQEPNVWAYLKHHDDIVFHDNDFEVFINPNNTTHQYFEFEVNAINTIFDLFLNKPYRDWGEPMISWNAQGLRTAVKVQGTLNDPSDTDKGWTVEIAIPFKALYTGNYLRLPSEGSFWRINFSRVEWDTKVVNGKYVKQTGANGYPKPEHNWVWSPQGIVDMHFPERWGYLQFTRKNDDKTTFSLPYAEKQKRYLWLVYYKEKTWQRDHYKFQLTLKDLGLTDTVMVDDHPNTLTLEATDHQFMALITDPKNGITWTINGEGLIQQLYDPKHE